MNRGSKVTGRLLDIACVACIILIVGVFPAKTLCPAFCGWTGLIPRLQKRAPPIKIAGVDWHASPATLVMALSTDCHYCKESSSFYRSLLAANGGNRFHAVAAFPQSPLNARHYLESEGVNVGDTRQVDFANLGVVGTPTLILDGNQTGAGNQVSWTGKLSPRREKKFTRVLV